ncbi:hypothetical protein ACOJBM_06215 [Rhizobium beringeri]
MSGSELAAQIRKTDTHRRIKVVAMSAAHHGSNHDLSSFDGVLSKPVRQQQLMTIMQFLKLEFKAAIRIGMLAGFVKNFKLYFAKAAAIFSSSALPVLTCPVRIIIGQRALRARIFWTNSSAVWRRASRSMIQSST